MLNFQSNINKFEPRQRQTLFSGHCRDYVTLVTGDYKNCKIHIRDIWAVLQDLGYNFLPYDFAIFYRIG